MTDEERERARAANRARQKKFRENKKLQGLTTTQARSKAKILTRKETEKKRKYWRQKQKSCRERRTSQKIRRKKEKDRMNVKVKRNQKSCINSISESKVNLTKTIQRAKLPKKPDTFAETMNMILIASPRKRKAMTDRGLLRTNTDRCNNLIVEILKEKMKNKKTRKTLLPGLKVLKKYRMLKTTSLNLGIPVSSLSRASATENTRKSKLEKNREEETHIFFQNSSIPVPDTKSPWYSCLCEYCTNVDLKLKALNDSLHKYKKQECKVADRYHAVNITLCDKEDRQQFQNKCCIDRECHECGKDKIVGHFAPLLSEHGHEPVVYTVWERQQGVQINGKNKVRVMMVKKKESLNSLVTQLADHLDTLAKHLFVARWQQKQFSNLITKVPPGWVVLNLDFAENYACISQMEIQSAHWAHNQATIHPIVCYYKCEMDNCETTIQETLLFISDDLKHDHRAVNCFVKKTNEHLINVRSLDIVKQIQFCDGCASQYKSCLAFCDSSHSIQDFGFTTERN
ncbi:hypothetical protein MAR_032460 [Mya arenaria]|uniref:Uncharacterized protein n=1 Tax=Mya arenaria TaxID=6604 RepID=A0ABY7FA48_MYAAR|nr:hypothetical protein MAR_032460 [Mya arenaria]